jgi:NAD(P)-dependent dehydrogenase (short-subunit alcohol dehydrogenase family)
MSDLCAIDEQTAIITGASRGIGKGIAHRFVNQGANVVICSRSREEIATAAAGITDAASAAEAVPVECDVTVATEVDRLVEKAVDEFGGVDILINNVGASFTEWASEIDQEGWQDVIETNLTGPFYCMQAVGEVMRGADGGAIVNVTSAATDWGSPRLSHYGAAKAGLDHLTKTVAAEWGRFGIRVNAVAPGLVATERIGPLVGVEANEIDETEVDRHLGTPGDIAKVVQFLASPGAGFVQGETLAAKGMPRIPRTEYHEDIETAMDW